MRKLLMGVLVFATATLAVTAAFACGDKLMLFARGARFGQVYSRAHAASILAYTARIRQFPPS